MKSVAENSVSAGRRWGRRVLGASVVAAMAATMMAAFASPASAGLIGVQIKSETSVSSSVRKSIDADCPPDTVLVGTGGSVSDNREVRIKDITPSVNSVEVEAVEDDDGTTGSWTVTATAVCAVRPPGYELVEQTDPSNSTTREAAQADCTGDNVVLGTAAEIDGISAGDVVIDTIIPTRDSVRVVANEDQNGTTANWSVAAWAICADPAAAPTIVSDISASTPNAKSESVACTSGSATGIGGLLVGPYGEIALSSLKPSEYLGTHLGFTQGAGDDDGASGNFTVTVYLICA